MADASAGILDAFVITLGLDPRQYQDEIKKYRDDRKRLAEEEKKHNDQQEEGQKRLTEGVRTLRNETAGFLFVLAGANGIKDFAQNILAGDAATGRLSKNLGIATEQLSAWEGAVKRVGGSPGDIDNSLRAISSAFQSLQLTGTTGHDADFQGLGVNARDLQDPSQTLLRIAEASSRMGRPEFNARLGRIGFDENTINLLAKGRTAVAALLEEQRKLGVVTDADTESAARFQDHLAQIETAIMGKARPALENLVTVVGEWLAKGDNLNTVLTVTEGLLGTIAAAVIVAYWPFAALAGGIALVATNMDKIKSAWSGLSGWWDDMKNSAIGRWLGGLGDATTGAGSFGGWVGGQGPRTINGVPLAFAGGAGSTSGLGEQDLQQRLATSGPMAGILARIRARESDGAGGYNAQAYNTPGGGNSAGLSQQNLIGMTLGQVFAYQRNVMRGRTGGSTGVGAYQFESMTLAQQAQAVYGPNWRNVRFTPDVQDRLAAHLYDSVKGNPAMLANTWAAFNPGVRAGMTAGRAVGGGSTSQTTSVGQIVVYSAATDADGIAHDMRGALAKRGLVVQANTGLSQ